MYYTSNYFEDEFSDDQVIRNYFNLSDLDVKKFEPKKLNDLHHLWNSGLSKL